jgi:hypothetical protein
MLNDSINCSHQADRFPELALSRTPWVQTEEGLWVHKSRALPDVYVLSRVPNDRRTVAHHTTPACKPHLQLRFQRLGFPASRSICARTFRAFAWNTGYGPRSTSSHTSSRSSRAPFRSDRRLRNSTNQIVACSSSSTKPTARASARAHANNSSPFGRSLVSTAHAPFARSAAITSCKLGGTTAIRPLLRPCCQTSIRAATPWSLCSLAS